MLPGIWTLYGPPFSAKTSFGLTLPAKIRFYDFEWGYDRAYKARQMETAGNISVERIILPVPNLEKRTTLVEGYRGFWGSWLEDYKKHLVNPEYSTVVVDTATYLWSVCTESWLEELQATPTRDGNRRQQLTQFDYGEPNSRMKLLMNLLKQNRKNLVMVHHEADEYVPLTIMGKPVLDDRNNPKMAASGKKIPDGFKYMRGISDWVLYFTLKEEAVLKDGVDTGQKVTVPVMKIEKSAEGLQLMGQEVRWPTYAKLQQLVDILSPVEA